MIKQAIKLGIVTLVALGVTLTTFAAGQYDDLAQESKALGQQIGQLASRENEYDFCKQDLSEASIQLDLAAKSLLANRLIIAKSAITNASMLMWELTQTDGRFGGDLYYCNNASEILQYTKAINNLQNRIIVLSSI